MSTQMTLWPIPPVISSEALAAGPMPASSPDGPRAAPSGQALAPASPSAPPDALTAWATSGTYGPLFCTSSPSAVLQRSLESKLQALLDVNGSPEYVLTWKHWDMPSGPPICALRASARPTSVNGCTGWPTPNCMDRLPSSNLKKRKEKGGCGNLKDVIPQVVGCPTPRAESGVSRKPGTGGECLQEQARLTGWSTPRAEERLQQNSHDSYQALSKQVLGTTPPCSPAVTAKPGALNPAFPCWLMGYPSSWLMAAPAKMTRGQRSCAASAMP